MQTMTDKLEIILEIMEANTLQMIYLFTTIFNINTERDTLLFLSEEMMKI